MMEFLVIGLVIIGYLYFSHQIDIVRGRVNGKTGTQILEGLYEWPDLGEFDAYAVGESHYQSAIWTIVGDKDVARNGLLCSAILVPEDENEHDKKAVRVDIDGYTVGYLDREDARSFRRRLKRINQEGAATKCQARLRGGFTLEDGKKASLGVELDLKSFY